MKLSTALVAVLALAVLAGCADSDQDSPSSPQAIRFEINPADGASAVGLDSPVTVSFASAVDRAVVERELHLISEFDMLYGTCPSSTMGPHGTMMDAMADSMLMHHLDNFHATAIDFHWNATGTECTMLPGSLMEPGTRYMVHFGAAIGRMMESHSGSMGNMNGMGGHGSGSMSGDMMFHFTTIGTSELVHYGHD